MHGQQNIKKNPVIIIVGACADGIQLVVLFEVTPYTVRSI